MTSLSYSNLAIIKVALVAMATMNDFEYLHVQIARFEENNDLLVVFFRPLFNFGGISQKIKDLNPNSAFMVF